MLPLTYFYHLDTQVEPGSNVAVFGLGAVGLAVIEAAVEAKAAKIIAGGPPDSLLPAPTRSQTSPLGVAVPVLGLRSTFGGCRISPLGRLPTL